MMNGNPSVKNAEKFARAAHMGQLYGGEFDYAMHLQATVNVARRFGIVSNVILSGLWLHDTLEDTDTSYETLVLFFGQEVADAVLAVTKPNGMTRKEAAAITLPKIRQNWRGLIMKLCDMSANVEAKGKKVNMYVKEYPEFKAALIHTDVPKEFQSVAQRLWAHLDGLILSVSGIYQDKSGKAEVINNGKVSSSV